MVILGHAIDEYNFDCLILKKIINSIHMPLFFVLSGYLFKIKEDTNLIEFTKKKIKSLLIPYCFFATLITFCHFLQILILKKEDLFFKILFSKDGIINTICMTTKSSFSNLWFLPCILIAEILLAIIIRNKEKIQWIVIVLLTAVGYYIANVLDVSLPLCIETALFSVLYLKLGNTLKNKDIIKKIDRKCFIVCFLIFCISSYVYFGVLMANSPAYYELRISFPIIFFIISISGNIAMIFFAKKIKNVYCLQCVGMNSLYIYGLHFIIQNLITIAINNVFGSNRSFIILIIVTSVNTVTCMLLINIYKMLKNRRKNENFDSKNVC